MRQRPPREARQGRPGIASLGRPDPRYDLAETPGFETAQLVQDRDARRARNLRALARRAGDGAEELHALADRIDPDLARHPQTVASHRYMREQRRRVIGAIWRLYHEG